MDDSKKYEGVIGPKQRAAMIKADNYSQELARTQKNPIAESNNDYDISMDIETRIAELRTCPVWEDHVRMLEDLLRKADEVASKFYNDDVETTLKLQKAEAEVERLRAKNEELLNALTKQGWEAVKNSPKHPLMHCQQCGELIGHDHDCTQAY